MISMFLLAAYIAVLIRCGGNPKCRSAHGSLSFTLMAAKAFVTEAAHKTAATRAITLMVLRLAASRLK
jgi:hypothetical protein